VPRQLVATYDYTDAEGQLLAQKVRTFPKGFYWRRPDGNGGWRKGTGGAPLGLYNLVALRRARAEHMPLYMVEGEKDCKALADREECATTVPGGAGKWRAEYAAEFDGARVVIIADRDDAGRDHALTCARALVAVAASVVVWESDRGKDAAEHFERGGDFDDFQLVTWWPEPGPEPEGEAPPADDTKVTGGPLDALATTRVSWLWQHWLPAGKVVMFDGDPGVAKSTLALDLAARVSTGAPMPGQPADATREPACVLLMTAEDGLSDTVKPRLVAAGADCRRVHYLGEVLDLDPEGNPRWRLPQVPSDLDLIGRRVRAIGAQLVIVDVLFAYLSGYINSWKDQDVRQAMAPVAKLADATGATFLLVRHLSKSGTGPAVYRGGGSIGIGGAARAVLAAAYDPRDETHKRRVLAVVKSNVGPLPTALTYEVVTDPMYEVGRIRWLGTSDIGADELLSWRPKSGDGTVTDAAAVWLGAVLADGPVAFQELTMLGRHEGFDVRALQRAAQQLGVVIRREGSGRDHHSVWELPSQGGQP